MLGTIGAVFEQYGGKVLIATLNSVDTILKRKLLRIEEQLYTGNTRVMLTGRQALRMVLEYYSTDRVAKQLFNVTHLQNIPYSGDDKLDVVAKAVMAVKPPGKKSDFGDAVAVVNSPPPQG